MRRVWNARLLGVGLIAALAAALAVAGAASARVNTGAGALTGGPTVVFIEGASNKTCAELDVYGAAGASWLELKFDSGDLPAVGSSKTIDFVTLTQTATDLWSWTSTKGIDAVFVKSGASGSNLYVYDPPTEATSGSGLTVPGENATSHVSFCYDEEEPPPPAEHGKLKVVKILAGDHGNTTFADFSFSIDGGPAVPFDADGVSDEYEFEAGTSHDVVEPEANGEGYATTYSDECTDGVIVADQTIVCTITNTFDHDGGEPGDLVVHKTAEGRFDVQHSWSIEKKVKHAGADDSTFVDDLELSLPDGGAGSVTWGVWVTHAQVEANFAVSGTIDVTNPNDEPISGVSVSDPGGIVDCDAAAGIQNTGLTVPANGSVSCAYTASPEGKPSTNTATATWSTQAGEQSVSGTATIAWTKGADIGLPATVDDQGALDGVEVGLDDLVDDQWQTTYDERWTCSHGTPSPNGGRTNEATVTWDDGSDSDSASVVVHCDHTPPPPPPPPPPPGNESMDLQIVKDATPQVQLVSGQADVAYTMVVKNNGPNQAHNVVVSDAAPGGVSFLAVTAQPVNGNCSVTPALLSCTLGTLGPGVERTIGISARVTQTGTYVNCATTTGDGGDTNPANNTDCAETLVTAPVTPPAVTPPVTPQPQPKPKPKAKPKATPNICRVLKVSTKMVKADGKGRVLVAKVTRSRNAMKGVKVRFKGAGVSKSARTNQKGVARVKVSTKRAGIIRVNITNAKACNTARIGVVGVFQPPVTG